jgi:hypothetical protein
VARHFHGIVEGFGTKCWRELIPLEHAEGERDVNSSGENWNADTVVWCSYRRLLLVFYFVLFKGKQNME